MGKGSSGPPQVDTQALIDQQSEANRISQITPFGSVFFGQFTQPQGTPGGAVTPTRSDLLRLLGPGGVPITDPNAPSAILGTEPFSVFPTERLLGFARERGLVNQQGLIPATGSGVPGLPENFEPTSQQTQIVELSPELQSLIDAQIRGAQAQADIAERRVAALPESTFDLSGIPGLPGAGEIGAIRDEAEQAFFNRQFGLLDPVFQLEEERLRDRLANQGQLGTSVVNPGAQTDLGIFQRERGDVLQRLAQDATIFGGQEASRVLSDALSARGQDINELLLQRSLPFNELAALQSGSQVNVPFFPNTGVPPIDVVGPATLQQQSALTGFNNRQANQRALMGGLLGLGGSLLTAHPGTAGAALALSLLGGGG